MYLSSYIDNKISINGSDQTTLRLDKASGSLMLSRPSPRPPCDRIWGQTPKIQGIQGAIDVGDSEGEAEAVDVGGPSEPSGLDLNNPIEVDKYQTPPRNSPRRKIHMEKTLQQKLTPTTAATKSSNVSRRKVAKKIKVPDHEAKENMLEGLEGIAQTFFKMEKLRSQTMLKLEANRANRTLAMTKMKLETQ
jgi:hypothetical protein